MDLGLQDSVFIVTGGSRGLGRATARKLVEEGARVVISGRNEESLNTLVHELGDRAVGVVADNGQPGAEDLLSAVAHDSFGRLDGALISVGGPPAGGVLTTTEDQWRDSFESIIIGGLRIARAVIDAMSGPGSIAFVLSTSVKTPIPGLAISNGLRPGLAMAAKTLANEVGERGIRVNGLLPGRIATDRLTELDSKQGDPAAARARQEAVIPLGRYGEPGEFAAVATFLLSPASSYVSGVMVPVDGGALQTF